MATKTEISTTPAAAGQAAVTLSNEEILRYSRHLIMPEVGMEGQLKLKQAKVLCIGTGGLGRPARTLSCGRGSRPHRLGRFRLRRPHQSSAADSVQHRLMSAGRRSKPRPSASAI